MNDPRIVRWLNAYALVERFPSIPQPGFNDPQLQKVFTVIAGEHMAIDREEK
jgi:hypothetical protein